MKKTNTKIVLEYDRIEESYLVKEVTGSLDPVVGRWLTKAKAQELIDAGHTVTIRIHKRLGLP